MSILQTKNEFLREKYDEEKRRSFLWNKKMEESKKKVSMINLF